MGPRRIPVLVSCTCGYRMRTDYPAREVRRGGRRVLVPEGHLTVDGLPHHQLMAGHTARACRPAITLIRILPGSAPCDSRCYQATSDTCACSCGGQQHGAAYRKHLKPGSP